MTERTGVTTKFFPYLPAIILIVVALHQIYLAKTQQLSPWKGGGFGMFSSTQYGSSRYVRVFISAPDRDEELQIPESLADSAQRVATLPSNRLLTELGQGVARREQRYERPVSRVRIEVWRTEFDEVTLTPKEKRIKEYVYQVH